MTYRKDQKFRKVSFVYASMIWVLYGLQYAMYKGNLNIL